MVGNNCKMYRIRGHHMPLPNNLEHMQAMFDNIFAVQKVTVSFDSHHLARLGRHFAMKLWPDDYHSLVNEVFEKAQKPRPLYCARLMRHSTTAWKRRQRHRPCYVTMNLLSNMPYSKPLRLSQWWSKQKPDSMRPKPKTVLNRT